MKKIFPLFIVLFIGIFSLAVYHATANVFPGNLSGGTASSDTQTGSLVVTGVPSGTLIRVYDYNTRLRTEYSVTAGSSQSVIPNVKPGQYYATYTDSAGVESDPSNMAAVLPPAVTVSKESEASKTITVRGAIPSAEVRLYSENNAVLPISRLANTQGIAIFENLPTGKNYRAIQIINGATSAPSAEGVDIIPDKVNVLKERDSGPENNQGSIQVYNATIGHTIEIYNIQNRVTPVKPPVLLESTTTYYFNDLPAGTYVVVQKKDGLTSLDSDEITIGDEKKPIITLNGPAKIEMETPYQNPPQFVDPGFTATDNIDGVITNPEFLSTTISPVLPSPIRPGSYIITYTARDRAGNTETATRELLIRPNTVSLVAENTSQTNLDDVYGEITVIGAFPDATLYLYQDGSNQLVVPPITASNEGTYTIENVPVGTKYYVIQEVNGIESNPSARVDILDKTPPRLVLNGDGEIILTAGEEYVEQGAIATDNIDADDALRVITTGTVNTNQPGVYTITYNVTDAAGNKAAQVTRTVIVKPRAVVAYGSAADIGQIGVSNIMPSSARVPVRLILYKYTGTDEGGGVQVAEAEITTGETSYVFTRPDNSTKTRLDPGQYYVVQSINEQESIESNVVEIVDQDRPYIELSGLSTYTFVWNTASKDGLYTSTNAFNDPFGTASDYLDGNLTNAISCTINEADCYTGSAKTIQFTRPGSYEITYTVRSARGTEANPKKRLITIAPTKPGTILVDTAVKSRIIVPDVFQDGTTKTTVNLYNAYGQKVTEKVTTTGTVTFDNVPSGRGYYVTQTVSAIESTRSNTVNVSGTDDGDTAKFVAIGSFSIKSPNAVGVIDHTAGTIKITVPAGTSLSSLIPSFTTEGSGTSARFVQVSGVRQTSGQSAQNFTQPVVYTVTDGTLTKSYVVSVSAAAGVPSSVWKETVPKDITPTTAGVSATLTANERREASETGVSFFTPSLTVHVPAANVIETAAPTITMKKMAAYSFLNWRDPAWTDSLSEVTEITWGGKNTTFMQPIEVEVNGTANQTFVRLVRGADGKLYAIAQPSEMVGDKMIGFVQQSGIYAVLNKAVPKPVIVQGSSYVMSSSMPNAAIYYTTDATDIGFYRSGRNRALASYTFNGVPSDVSKWTLYQSRIEPPDGDVFAFAMSDQIITPLASAVSTKVSDWSTDDVPVVSSLKTWSITFNKPIERKALYSGSIYVTDANGKQMDVALQLSSDGKTLSVAPRSGYTRNQQYTLWIRNEVKNTTSDGAFLKESVSFTFTVK